MNGDETGGILRLTSIFDSSQKFDHVRRFDDRLTIFRFGRIVVRQWKKKLEMIDQFASIFALIDQRKPAKDESIVDLFLFDQRDRTDRADLHRHFDRRRKVKRPVVFDRVQLDDAVGIVFEKDSPELFDRVGQRILSDDQRSQIDGKSLNESRVDVRRAEEMTEIETIVIIYRGERAIQMKRDERAKIYTERCEGDGSVRDVRSNVPCDESGVQVVRDLVSETTTDETIDDQ